MSVETDIKRHDEKYISIEYDMWLNKYKPLEEENEILKSKLIDSSVKVRIILNTMKFREYYDIGYITFEVDKGLGVKIENIDAVRSQLDEQFFQSRPYSRYIPKEVAISMIEADRLLLEQVDRKIKSIPRFIKWLFKIKSINTNQQ